MFVLNQKIPDVLEAACEIRERFQRDDQVDQTERDELAATIRDSPQTYSAEEDILVNKVCVKLGALEWKNFEELDSPDHLVKMGKIFIAGSSSGCGPGDCHCRCFN